MARTMDWPAAKAAPALDDVMAEANNAAGQLMAVIALAGFQLRTIAKQADETAARCRDLALVARKEVAERRRRRARRY